LTNQNKKALKALFLFVFIMLFLTIAYHGGYAIGKAIANMAQ